MCVQGCCFSRLHHISRKVTFLHSALRFHVALFAYICSVHDFYNLISKEPVTFSLFLVVCFAFSAGMTQMTVGRDCWSGLCSRLSPLLCRRRRRVTLLIKQLLDLDSVNSIFNSPLPAELNSEQPDV